MVKKMDRKKVNFMLTKDIRIQLNQLIPAGERSDFINQALQKALVKYSRQKAMEAIEKFRKENKISITTEEIIKLKNYGRQ